MPILTSAAIAIPHKEPPEGRKAFPLQGLVFVSGAEVFTWSSSSLGAGAPSHIVSMWVDTTGLAAGKTLTLNINNGQQIVVVQTGQQGYVVVTVQMPFSVLISTNNGAAVTPIVILYNYNALYTGMSGAGGGAGSTGSGGAGGGGGGTGGGGNVFEPRGRLIL